MKGSYQIIVQNNRVQYKFSINRNIYLHYSKSKLKKEYLQEKEFNSIINQIPDAIKTM